MRLSSWDNGAHPTITRFTPAFVALMTSAFRMVVSLMRLLIASVIAEAVGARSYIKD